MAKGPKTGQVPAAEAPHKLSYLEERFIEHYIKNGGNATQAYLSANRGVTYDSAKDGGCRMLTKSYIIKAIEGERERLATVAQFSREDALKILVAMATATIDDFTDVLSDPANKDNYAGLGDKRYALTSADKSFKNGNSVKLADRRAALNDLWDKLGFDKTASERDRRSVLERFAGSLAKVGSGREDK